MCLTQINGVNDMADIAKLMDGVRSTEKEPSDRLALVRDSGAVLYEVVGGSHAYGTSLPTSDRDMRGVFSLPASEYLSTTKPCDEVSDQRKIEGKKKNDDIFYTLRRFFELLKGANPNMIELLWMPEDCILARSPEIDVVIRNRDAFISKACLGSHFGYAKDQIAKARGKNKKVNNPQAKERPKKLDFCRVIPCIPNVKAFWTHPDVPSSRFPFRPIPLKEMPWVDLSKYHVAAVEHMRDAYRLYWYGDESKGVFRGDDMLVCDSIPMDDEWPKFSGILLYDESEYERAVKDWKSYWDWMENRNVHRWVDQEKGLVDYDAKNMMHCIRLLVSGLSIVKDGFPLVRFAGSMRSYLLDIRHGKPKYDDLMAEVETRVSEMEEAAKFSSIPDKVDNDRIESLYAEVSEMAWKRLFGKGGV